MAAYFFCLFFMYMNFLYKKGNDFFKDRLKPNKAQHTSLNTIIALGCLVTILLSAHFLLLKTESIVHHTGMGSSLIGVFIIGIAPASPELFTAISGFRQKARGISLGTLIGSNIVNPLLAIGGGALMSAY